MMGKITPDLVEWMVADDKVCERWRSIARRLGLARFIPDLDVGKGKERGRRRGGMGDKSRLKNLFHIWEETRPKTFTIKNLKSLLASEGLHDMWMWVNLMTQTSPLKSHVTDVVYRNISTPSPLSPGRSYHSAINSPQSFYLYSPKSGSIGSAPPSPYTAFFQRDESPESSIYLSSLGSSRPNSQMSDYYQGDSVSSPSYPVHREGVSCPTTPLFSRRSVSPPPATSRHTPSSTSPGWIRTPSQPQITRSHSSAGDKKRNVYTTLYRPDLIKLSSPLYRRTEVREKPMSRWEKVSPISPQQNQPTFRNSSSSRTTFNPSSSHHFTPHNSSSHHIPSNDSPSHPSTSHNSPSHYSHSMHTYSSSATSPSLQPGSRTPTSPHSSRLTWSLKKTGSGSQAHNGASHRTSHSIANNNNSNNNSSNGFYSSNSSIHVASNNSSPTSSLRETEKYSVYHDIHMLCESTWNEFGGRDERSNTTSSGASSSSTGQVSHRSAPGSAGQKTKKSQQQQQEDVDGKNENDRLQDGWGVAKQQAAQPENCGAVTDSSQGNNIIKFSIDKKKRIELDRLLLQEDALSRNNNNTIVSVASSCAKIDGNSTNGRLLSPGSEKFPPPGSGKVLSPKSDTILSAGGDTLLSPGRENLRGGSRSPMPLLTESPRKGGQNSYQDYFDNLISLIDEAAKELSV